jgi:hypothetical protein
MELTRPAWWMTTRAGVERTDRCISDNLDDKDYRKPARGTSLWREEINGKDQDTGQVLGYLAGRDQTGVGVAVARPQA